MGLGGGAGGRAGEVPECDKGCPHPHREDGLQGVDKLAWFGAHPPSQAWDKWRHSRDIPGTACGVQIEGHQDGRGHGDLV